MNAQLAVDAAPTAAGPFDPASPNDDYAGIDAALRDGGHVRGLADGTAEVWIAVEGIVCAACGQAIEAALRALPGVRAVRVAIATRRARVVWDPAATSAAELFRAVARAGYQPFPAAAAEVEHARRAASRLLLWRLLVAACAMMQVMMYAAPEYTIAPGDISPDILVLLRWAQWMITAPVMLFCAWPIFERAVRGLRARRIAMELPAALGIALAFGASTVATFEASGDVWFDSVTMFVFFLLLARWLEGMARDRATMRLEALHRRLPAIVTRVRDDGRQTRRLEPVAPSALRPGDLVLVAPGETFAADGRIVEGDTEADESLLTGESRPLGKPCGASVRAGSANVLAAVLVRVERAANDSTLARIRELVDEAAAERPDWMRTADRWATVFLAGVLVLAAAAWLGWRFIDPAQALPVAIAVLIVTCPCALSLATPSAMLAATAALARRGIWLREPAALERLARVHRLAFDKTGTLTRGRPALTGFALLRENADTAEVLAAAAALARCSRHPLSQALATAAPDDAPARGVREVPGAGLAGEVGGRGYRLGSLAFVMAGAPAPVGPDDERPATWLADDDGLLARFVFDDPLRDDAGQAVAALHGAGVRVTLLSGDGSGAVARVAAELGLEDATGALAPADKLAALRGWQARGEVVAMVGDGINDGPALAGADVSIALGEAAPLAHAQADLVLASGRLADLVAARDMAHRAVRVMRSNLAWALAYNAACVPLALIGWMPPWAAGLGMALSSLLVIGNGLRLLRHDGVRPQPRKPHARHPRSP